MCRILKLLVLNILSMPAKAPKLVGLKLHIAEHRPNCFAPPTGLSVHGAHRTVATPLPVRHTNQRAQIQGEVEAISPSTGSKVREGDFPLQMAPLDMLESITEANLELMPPIL